MEQRWHRQRSSRNSLHGLAMTRRLPGSEQRVDRTLLAFPQRDNPPCLSDLVTRYKLTDFCLESASLGAMLGAEPFAINVSERRRVRA